MNSQALRIVAMALAIGAVLLGYFGLQLSKAPTEQAVQTQVPQQADSNRMLAIIAKHELQAGTPIKEDDLDSIEVPVRREGAFMATETLVGQTPVLPISAGEMILESHFYPGSRMAHLLSAGERAIAISVTEVIGGGGYVQPGDYVDVLLYLRGGTTEVKRSVARTLIEGVQVLAYGKSLALSKDGQVANSNGDTKQAETTSRSAVLAVPRDEVEKLMLAENAGVIRLAVVSSRENETGGRTASAKSKPVGIDELTGARRSSKAAGIPVYRGTTRSFESVSR